MSQLTAARTRLLGLGATIAILLLVAGTPVVLIAIGATPWQTDLANLGNLLTRPDDGTVALVVVGVVAWIAWAVMAITFTVEVLARLRGIPAPHLPGLGGPQRFAGQLVAVAALLFAVAPTLAPVFAAPPAGAAPTPEPPAPAALLPETAQETPAAQVRATPLPAHDPEQHDPEQTKIDYTVRRGDSLWKIAEEHLGDGTRYVEIVALNDGALNGRPDFIAPGLVLRLPGDADGKADTVEPPHQPGETHIVEAGETLWAIAKEELGDPTRYPEIFDASRATVQPGGDRLRDPHLIQPRWRLTVPTPPAPDAGEPDDTPEPRHPPIDDEPPTDDPHQAPTPEPTAEPSTPNTPAGSADETSESDDANGADGADGAGAPWILPGLTGAGALLAGALLLTLRARRRTNLRYRRPGHINVPPPAELRPVEKTARLSGTATASAVRRVDHLLRHLADELERIGQPPPKLVTVELSTATITLRLDQAAELPAPWEGRDTTWTALLSHVPDADQLPPYPLLVSVGQTVDGHLVLVNLEHLGSVALTGDAEHAAALGRHIAAELALNPWSVLVDVDLLGFAPELVCLDPTRLHHHPEPDPQFLATLATELSSAPQRGIGDPDPFHVVLTTATARQEDEIRNVVRIINTSTLRTGTSVVTVRAAPGEEDTVFELTHDGRLTAPQLGLDLRAAGLTEDEATASAAIADLTRTPQSQPIHTDDSATEGWRTLTDQAGALRTELTETRPIGPAGTGSVLPDAAAAYEQVAATTAEDVKAMAPFAPDSTRRKVEETDPSLDDDVAAWFDPDCPLPRLAVLGLVKAVSRGDATAVASRKPHYTEMLTFLALHPNGVSSQQVAEAFSLTKARARTDLGIVRKWLGTNPRTGRPHLPSANDSQTAVETGVTTYQLEDALLDADLFRRLRARGQARGAQGHADYDTALRLVKGQPFDQLRETGWSWLLDDDHRLPDTLACAVVDVAHIVVTDALADGHLDRAHHAAETARTASPYDDIARLDLVAVLRAQGHDDTAQQFLTDEVCNRTDDHLGPIDLPERTATVIKVQHKSGNT
jgi:nucleoid-associated protein YgaU